LSLSAQAVTAPFTLVVNKTAVGGDATFDYSATGNELPGSFSLATSGGTASRTFSNLTPLVAGGTRTVTEGAPPPLWSFTSLSCSVTTAGDGKTPFSTTGQTVSITNAGAGATLTCTYTNTRNKATPTVTTNIHDPAHAVVTSVPLGTTVHDSASVSGGFG